MKKLCRLYQLLHHIHKNHSGVGIEKPLILKLGFPILRSSKAYVRTFSLHHRSLHISCQSPRSCRTLTSNLPPSESSPVCDITSALQKISFRHRTFHTRPVIPLWNDSCMIFSQTPYSHPTAYSYSTAPSSFLKNQSALLVKRPSRKKIPKIYDEGKTLQVDNVVAYAVSEEIRLESLKTMLIKQGLYTIGELPKDVEKVLHVQGKYNTEKKPKEIFVFEDGSVVFWCVPEIERGAFLKLLSKHAQAPYQNSLVLYEREELDFVYSKDKTGLLGDVIQLKKGDQDTLEKHLELYTISNALSQSVKLAIWESSLDRYVTSIVAVTEDLRLGRKIGMSRRQVLMKTGELFSLKHLINLSSDLLDIPDFYWERSTLEPLYQSMHTYLHMSRRTRVMNEKLSHCCELTELLSTELNDAHHTRLEIMIIILILLEVVFEIIHFSDRYTASGLDDSEAAYEEMDKAKVDAEGAKKEQLQPQRVANS